MLEGNTAHSRPWKHIVRLQCAETTTTTSAVTQHTRPHLQSHNTHGHTSSQRKNFPVPEKLYTRQTLDMLYACDKARRRSFFYFVSCTPMLQAVDINPSFCRACVGYKAILYLVVCHCFLKMMRKEVNQKKLYGE